MKHSMTKLPWGLAMVLNLLLMSAAIGCSASTSALPIASLSGWNPASPAEDGQFEQQSAADSPLIHHASVQPTKVFPGDTMTVTAEVSDPSGISSVTANMGDIETISLSLIEGSIYHGTWQGQWLVHDTTVRDYVTTIVAANSIGKSSATDVLWRDAVTYERYHKEVYGTANTSSTTMQTALTLTFSPNVDGDFMILGRADIGQTTDTSDQTEAEILCYITGTATGGSATTLVDTALDEADGYYVGWILEMTSGVNIGEFQTVTGFVQSTNTLTTATFDQANSAGDTYKLYRVINSILFYPNATDEAAAFGAHDVLSLDNAKTYNFPINYRSVNGTNLATIKNYGINAMAVAGYGGFTAHGDDDAGTSGTGGWNTIVTATVDGTAGDDYLVIGSLEMQGSSTTKTIEVRILEDDVTGWGEISRIPTNVNQWHMFQDMRRVTLASTGSHNFKLQWLAGPGSTATVRRAHIAAVNIDTLSDTASEYTEEEAEESTASTDWVVKMFHQFTPDTCWNGLRCGYGMMSSKDTTDYVYGGIDEDGTEIGTTNMMPNNKASDYMPLWTAFHRFHAPAQWTIDLKYRAASGGTAYTKNDRVLVIRLDNLNPFGDLGHTGYLDTFDEAGEDTVYIQGCYYYNAVPYDAVTVTYYDGNNDIVASDSTADVNANGVIESQLRFPDYSDAEPGTWHAVSTMDAILTAYSQTIPSTYSANWTYSVRECAFEVTAAAIPEFPNALAGIGVAGLCFGIYWWMRRRRTCQSLG